MAEMEPPMDEDERRFDSITETIIGAAFKVANEMGSGFLEKAYENALFLELLIAGLDVRQQEPIAVRYRGTIVGEYFADLLVQDCVLIELKVARGLDDIHMAQCLNYLKATGLKICLLINFGKSRIEIKRIANNL